MEVVVLTHKGGQRSDGNVSGAVAAGRAAEPAVARGVGPAGVWLTGVRAVELLHRFFWHHALKFSLDCYQSFLCFFKISLCSLKHDVFVDENSGKLEMFVFSFY